MHGLAHEGAVHVDRVITANESILYSPVHTLLTGMRGMSGHFKNKQVDIYNMIYHVHR